MSSTATTRRGAIGAAAGAGAGFAFGGPILDALAAKREKDCLPSPPGVATRSIAVAPNGTVWVADSQATTITARRAAGTKRGRSIDVGGAPAGIAISPDGRTAAVSTAFYDRPGLAIVKLRSGQVERIEVGAEPGAVAFTPGGSALYVLERGPKGTLARVGLDSGRAGRPIPVGRHPRGVAITADGQRALVALNGHSALAIVELGSKPGVHRIKVPRFPDEVAVSPDGRRAIVTHNGFGDRIVSVIDLRERKLVRKTAVGKDPAGVAFSASGARAIVTTSSGAVVLDRHGRRLRRVKLGGYPGPVAASGGAAFVADFRSGRLHRVRIGGR